MKVSGIPWDGWRGENGNGKHTEPLRVAATNLARPPSACLLNGMRCAHLNRGTWRSVRTGGWGFKPLVHPGGNYRFSEPELNAIHLHQRKGLQRGFLPDLHLHVVADAPGPNHQVAQGLAPRWGDEGAPEVDVPAHKFRSDGGSRRKRRNSSCNQEGSTKQEFVSPNSPCVTAVLVSPKSHLCIGR